MRISNFSCSVCLLLSGVFASCNDDDVSVEKYTVFISGEIDGQAVYWKNGEVNFLAKDSDASYTAEWSAIASSSSDVYVAGTIKGDVIGAAYWKNGQLLRLSDKTSQVYSIYVFGSDVYVTGFELNNTLNARLWKNGKSVELQGLNDGSISVCIAVAVSEDDTHAVGIENFEDRVFAKYWKNGEQVEIISDLPYYSNFTDVAVSDGNVHIVGYIADENGFRTYKYWVNGIETELPTLVSARFVEISDGDVYLLDGSARHYSKNNVEFQLDRSTMPDALLSTTGLTIVDGDVYVTALLLGNNNERLGGFVWKNGVIQKELSLEQSGVEYSGIVLVKN